MKKQTRKHIDCPSCGLSLAISHPDRLCHYLEFTGWKKGNAYHHWQLYTKRMPDGLAELEVPMYFEALDWPRRYWEFLHNLKLVEQREIPRIVHDIKKAWEKRDRSK